MKKELKDQIIETISAQLKEYPNFYVTDIAGLNAKDTGKLRRACFEEGIKLTVVKNTLFRHVIKGMENEELNTLCDVLKGNSAIMYSESPNAPAKLIKKLQKSGMEKPVLKGAYAQECAFIGADKLDELRERMEQNLISSIDFLKQLLQMARELLEAEKEIEKPMDKRAQARAALTDLFQSIKSEETPIIVEQVVNDIDNEVVNIIRQFNDAFQSVTARREIKKKLRSILWIKYQIKDNDVFEKAYSYIEMYY